MSKVHSVFQPSDSSRQTPGPFNVSYLLLCWQGNWRGISRQYVTTRTPTQVRLRVLPPVYYHSDGRVLPLRSLYPATQIASHAQKHSLRTSGAVKRKSRFTALEDEAVSRTLLRAWVGFVKQGHQACFQSPVRLFLPDRLCVTCVLITHHTGKRTAAGVACQHSCSNGMAAAELAAGTHCGKPACTSGCACTSIESAANGGHFCSRCQPEAHTATAHLSPHGAAGKGAS